MAVFGLRFSVGVAESRHSQEWLCYRGGGSSGEDVSMKWIFWILGILAGLIVLVYAIGAVVA